MKYGSRHPKRTIGKALLHPMSNLIATQQVRRGDLIKVDFDFENSFDLGAAVLRMSSVRDDAAALCQSDLRICKTSVSR
jgi:hypothetical protein